MNILILLDENGKKILESPQEEDTIDRYDNQLFAIDIVHVTELGNSLKQKLLYKQGDYIGTITNLAKTSKYKNEFYYQGLLVQRLKAIENVPLLFEKEAAGFIIAGRRDDPDGEDFPF